MRRLKSFVCSAAWLAGAALVATSGANAQVIDADRIQREQQEEQRRSRAIDDVRRNQQAPVTIERPKPSTSELSVQIPIRKVIVEGSKVIKPEAIRAVVAPLEGRTISYQELLKTVEALNQLYRDRQLVGLAFLPPQQITEGTLRISMLDSRFGKLEVDGARYTDTGFVGAFIRSEPGGVVSIKSLSDDVERLRATTDLGATLDLKPGGSTGEVDAKLTVVEPPRNFSVSGGVDNFGAYATGRLRGVAGLSVASLTGHRDSFNIDTIYTRGSKVGLASYDTPIGFWGTRIRVEGSAAQTNVIQGLASVLDIKGESIYGRATLSQVIAAQPGFRLIASIADQGRRGFTLLSGVQVGRENYQAWTPAVETIVAVGPVAAFLRGSGSFGTNYVVNDASFRKSVFDGLVTVSFPENVNLQLRGTAQYAPLDDPLPVSERFSLGGFYRMRGYPVDYLTGVQGFYSAGELGRVFLLNFGSKTLQVRPYVLAEYGGVKDLVVNPLRGVVAASAGGGIDFLFSNGSLRFGVAKPLTRTEYEEDHPSTTFYFSAVATLP